MATDLLMMYCYVLKKKSLKLHFFLGRLYAQHLFSIFHRFETWKPIVKRFLYKYKKYFQMAYRVLHFMLLQIKQHKAKCFSIGTVSKGLRWCTDWLHFYSLFEHMAILINAHGWLHFLGAAFFTPIVQLFNRLIASFFWVTS